jgi:hypothetical protein
MDKTKAEIERRARLSQILADHADAFAMGACDAFGQAAITALKHSASETAHEIIEAARKRYGARFEAELELRDINVSETGENDDG